MPWLLERLGAVVKSCHIDRPLATKPGEAPPPFAAVCHLVVDSVEAFAAAFAPHAKEGFKDLPNYTNLKPIVQHSETAQLPVVQP